VPEEVLVDRDEVAVMFTRVADEIGEIGRAWAALEEKVGSLRGRKFYGAFDAATSEYRACVQVREEDDAAALGLELGTLPGGSYVRVRLRGEPPGVYELIGPTFKRLAQRDDCDSSRPSLEFYRRRDEIDLLLPVA
jgi:hypothetical protein